MRNAYLILYRCDRVQLAPVECGRELDIWNLRLRPVRYLFQTLTLKACRFIQHNVISLNQSPDADPTFYKGFLQPRFQIAFLSKTQHQSFKLASLYCGLRLDLVYPNPKRNLT